MNNKPTAKTNSHDVLNELINLNDNQVKIVSCHNNHGDSKQHKIKRLKYNVRIVGSTQTSTPLNNDNTKIKSELVTPPVRLKAYTDHDYNYQYRINDHDYHKVH